MTESKPLVKISNAYSASKYLLRLGLFCSFVSLLLMVTFFGVTFGMVFFTGLGLYLILLGLILKPYENEGLRKFMVYFKIAFITITLIWLISFIVIEGFIFSTMKPDLANNAKYVVILGAGLKGDMPSHNLTCRLDTGVRYLKKHPDKLVVVSGGQGAGENTTEARVMANYLINHGIGRERIIKEEGSGSTFENMSNTREILDRREGTGSHKIIIITSDYHLFRSKMLARREKFIAYGMPAKMSLAVRINYSLREYFAVVKSYFVDK